ncbi:hypothetical protein QBC47DRAFT_402549 [Echria macrotheca]|uniref:Uncharacterized protein n=1 Tax=Echria macrotheca TaxID=438768 RepID=A0AAJ0F9B7_9PEZI|nr:hypothetical protein QBC47DRAFT_402549 [Echria macrotheca]
MLCIADPVLHTSFSFARIAGPFRVQTLAIGLFLGRIPTLGIKVYLPHDSQLDCGNISENTDIPKNHTRAKCNCSGGVNQLRFKLPYSIGYGSGGCSGGFVGQARALDAQDSEALYRAGLSDEVAQPAVPVASGSGRPLGPGVGVEGRGRRSPFPWAQREAVERGHLWESRPAGSLPQTRAQPSVGVVAGGRRWLGDEPSEWRSAESSSSPVSTAAIRGGSWGTRGGHRRNVARNVAPATIWEEPSVDNGDDEDDEVDVDEVELVENRLLGRERAPWILPSEAFVPGRVGPGGQRTPGQMVPAPTRSTTARTHRRRPALADLSEIVGQPDSPDPQPRQAGQPGWLSLGPTTSSRGQEEGPAAGRDLSGGADGGRITSGGDGDGDGEGDRLVGEEANRGVRRRAIADLSRRAAARRLNQARDDDSIVPPPRPQVDVLALGGMASFRERMGLGSLYAARADDDEETGMVTGSENQSGAVSEERHGESSGAIEVPELPEILVPIDPGTNFDEGSGTRAIVSPTTQPRDEPVAIPTIEQAEQRQYPDPSGLPILPRVRFDYPLISISEAQQREALRRRRFDQLAEFATLEIDENEEDFEEIQLHGADSSNNRDSLPFFNRPFLPPPSRRNRFSSLAGGITRQSLHALRLRAGMHGMPFSTHTQQTIAGSLGETTLAA